jgi:hypothetical protein
MSMTQAGIVRIAAWLEVTADDGPERDHIISTARNGSEDFPLLRSDIAFLYTRAEQAESERDSLLATIAELRCTIERIDDRRLTLVNAMRMAGIDITAYDWTASERAAIDQAIAMQSEGKKR